MCIYKCIFIYKEEQRWWPQYLRINGRTISPFPHTITTKYFNPHSLNGSSQRPGHLKTMHACG